MERKYRVLLVASHPIQYAVPLYRLMAKHPKLDILVAYCSLQGAEPGIDPEFGIEVTWDVPLLEGYPWIYVPNCSPRPGLGRFLGLINPGLWQIIRQGHWDAVIAHMGLGYIYASFWIAAIAAKLNGIAFLFGTDAYDLQPRDGRRWKIPLKVLIWPRLFRLADVVLVMSSGGVHLMQRLGIPIRRVVLTPHVVDNEWWIKMVAQVDRKIVRRRWNIPDDALVVLFCGKLQPWKRPMDLLYAFAQAGVDNAYLLFIGEGPLRVQLESEVQRLRISEKVRFLGFVNQSQLPFVYRSSDILVLPSEYEAFGLVVNEAMLCSLPVVISDRVGAKWDLVEEGVTGFVYPCGDVIALANILRDLLSNRGRLEQMSRAARQRVENWTPQKHVDAIVEAIERAVNRRSKKDS
ncbi:MAG: hypothetical protein SLRJCFUN_001875 [Candidatus Fervidibacter sp.]